MTNRLLGTFGWAAVDESVSRRAGELGRRYRRSHRGVGTADLIIAATALELGADLVTTNVRHFPMFRGLRAPYP
jgi:predicted nucleic acid-binding protein